VNETVKALIPAVVAYVVETGGYVTKTKLLKLLYLIDVEFYRFHRQTFTGFDWKFFHLGPWSAEFDPLINDLVASGTLIERTGTKPEYETKFYQVAESHDLGKLFKSATDEFALRGVLRTWSESSTGEILDHVYFRTEPMERGVRNERLDFSSISEGPVQRYVRPSSGISPKEIKKMRAKFRSRSKEVDRRGDFSYTPPRYDDEFKKGIDKLESAEN
jgi:hypothetical protein